jgi:hypothetical protein
VNVLFTLNNAHMCVRVCVCVCVCVLCVCVCVCVCVCCVRVYRRGVWTA